MPLHFTPVRLRHEYYHNKPQFYRPKQRTSVIQQARLHTYGITLRVCWTDDSTMGNEGSAPASARPYPKISESE